MSYIWYPVIAIVTVVLVGIIVSYITGPLKREEIDTKLIMQMSDVSCCFLPKRWRKRVRCGVKYQADHEKQVTLCEYFHS